MRAYSVCVAAFFALTACSASQDPAEGSGNNSSSGAGPSGSCGCDVSINGVGKHIACGASACVAGQQFSCGTDATITRHDGCSGGNGAGGSSANATAATSGQATATSGQATATADAASSSGSGQMCVEIGYVDPQCGSPCCTDDVHPNVTCIGQNDPSGGVCCVPGGAPCTGDVDCCGGSCLSGACAQ